MQINTQVLTKTKTLIAVALGFAIIIAGLGGFIFIKGPRTPEIKSISPSNNIYAGDNITIKGKNFYSILYKITSAKLLFNNQEINLDNKQIKRSKIKDIIVPSVSGISIGDKLNIVFSVNLEKRWGSKKKYSKTSNTFQAVWGNPEKIKFGDLDQDSQITEQDLSILVKILNQERTPTNLEKQTGDLNSNNRLDFSDWLILSALIDKEIRQDQLPILLGDINKDKKIDKDDIARLEYLIQNPDELDPVSFFQADLDFDEDLTETDLDMLGDMVGGKSASEEPKDESGSCIRTIFETVPIKDLEFVKMENDLPVLYGYKNYTSDLKKAAVRCKDDICKDWEIEEEDWDVCTLDDKFKIRGGGGEIILTKCEDGTYKRIQLLDSIPYDPAGYTQEFRTAFYSQIGADGLPIFAYASTIYVHTRATYSTIVDTIQTGLKVVKCQDKDCQNIKLSSIDEGGKAGGLVITPSDGLPFVHYSAENPTDHHLTSLKVAKCLTSDCAKFETVLIDQGGSGGIAAISSDGLPVISYIAQKTINDRNVLKLAKCQDAGCKTNIITPITKSEIDYTWVSGPYELTLIDDLPIIIYGLGGPGSISYNVLGCQDKLCNTFDISYLSLKNINSSLPLPQIIFNKENPVFIHLNNYKKSIRCVEESLCPGELLEVITYTKGPLQLLRCSDPSCSSCDTGDAPNHPPIANAGEDKTVAVWGKIELDGSSSYDQDGDNLTYKWQVLTGLGYFDDAEKAKSIFNAPGSTMEVRTSLTVSDGSLSSSDEILIIVK